MPVLALNVRPKYFGSVKPTEYAISENDMRLSTISRSALRMRMWRTKSMGDMPKSDFTLP